MGAVRHHNFKPVTLEEFQLLPVCPACGAKSPSLSSGPLFGDELPLFMFCTECGAPAVRID